MVLEFGMKVENGADTCMHKCALGVSVRDAITVIPALRHGEKRVAIMLSQEIAGMDESELTESAGINFFHNITLAVRDLSFGEGNITVSPYLLFLLRINGILQSVP